VAKTPADLAEGKVEEDMEEVQKERRE